MGQHLGREPLCTSCPVQRSLCNSLHSLTKSAPHASTKVDHNNIDTSSETTHCAHITRKEGSVIRGMEESHVACGQSNGAGGIVKRLFRRRSSTRVCPEEESLENGSKLTDDQGTSNPSSPTDLNRNSVLLFSGTLVPLPLTDPLTEVAEGFLTPMQLYNSMNDGQLSPYMHDPSYMLIIDARAMGDYKQMHITTAIHASQVASNSEPLDSYTMIILYDHKGLSFSTKESPLRRTFTEMQSQNLDPYVLRGGFDELYLKHPYLSTSRILHNERERHKLIKNYPSIVIEDLLYLGRGDQASDVKIIQDLCITHVVNVCREHVNVFPDIVQYLQIEVDDDNSANLLREFAHVIQFITNAFQSHDSRVLVHCNLGRSRSSTLIIAYLMYSRKWTLQDAHQFLKERRPIIQPNRGFLFQLSRFEEILYGRKVSDVEQLYDSQ